MPELWSRTTAESTAAIKMMKGEQGSNGGTSGASTRVRPRAIHMTAWEAAVSRPPFHRRANGSSVSETRPRAETRGQLAAETLLSFSVPPGFQGHYSSSSKLQVQTGRIHSVVRKIRGNHSESRIRKQPHTKGGSTVLSQSGTSTRPVSVWSGRFPPEGPVQVPWGGCCYSSWSWQCSPWVKQGVPYNLSHGLWSGKGTWCEHVVLQITLVLEIHWQDKGKKGVSYLDSVKLVTFNIIA